MITKAAGLAVATLMAAVLVPLSMSSGPSSVASAGAVSGGPFAWSDARLGRAEQDENLSPTGCVEIVGKPLMRECLPCPPLWLGDPSIRCVAPVALRLTSCARLLVPPGRTIDSLLLERLCGPSAGE
jgi:hypothetical protein